MPSPVRAREVLPVGVVLGGIGAGAAYGLLRLFSPESWSAGVGLGCLAAGVAVSWVLASLGHGRAVRRFEDGRLARGLEDESRRMGGPAERP